MSTSATPEIRRLRPEDVERFVALRRESLETDPLAFGASVDDDRGLSREFVRAALADEHEQATFGCFDSEALVGLVGVKRDAALKRRHRAHVWGMYVSPGARGRGAGRALMMAAIEHARAWSDVEHLNLSVTGPAVVAKALYEALGFRFFGRESRALSWEGRFVDELHLVLDLRGPAEPVEPVEEEPTTEQRNNTASASLNSSIGNND